MKASMPDSITRLYSILLARHVALAIDHVAQQKRSTRRIRRKVSEMQLLVTKRSQRHRELRMHRQRRALRCYDCEGFSHFGRECSTWQKERPVQRNRLGGGTPLNVRDVHGPPAKGPHIKRTGSAKRKQRISETRERGVNDDSSFRLNVSENVSTHTVHIILEHGTPTISVCIEGMSRGLILDTGPNISIMQLGRSKSNVQVTTMEPYGITGDTLDIRANKQ